MGVNLGKKKKAVVVVSTPKSTREAERLKRLLNEEE